MEELERRLRGRASESEDAVRKRFAVARREIEHYALFDYLIVNRTVEEARDALRSVVIAHRSGRCFNAHLAESLLRISESALGSNPST